MGSRSAESVLTNTDGFPDFQPDTSSPSIGRIIRSQLVAGFGSSNAKNLPLGCHEAGRCWLLLSVRRCASPVPSARCQYRFNVDLSARADANPMRRLSGVHTGFESKA